ncbi:flavin reductase family protein [Rhodococcus sp. BP-252]|nr:flavin reductase family protein [Rhodococcus sp. BP-320]MBY6416172.1 flavin reductase family protein [Rhodococcus sp. BP-321]MBY6420167.1 flavin reductase family protein [Rhodococcus sp. BP-324]MBY6424846.1 flavin reductase family protein [Rhodococcus sp. BP-323]MBY6430448.1 flavin reductase family protein [Rhodococcus sp. BP-322]MBY6439324.1 flavin reductase family protein [Rhodococcus sp. BP-319]MBY6444285.1 flavin reductase family protein [Rhodococcus sp. BP-318]MBY6448996.1 flavin red
MNYRTTTNGLHAPSTRLSPIDSGDTDTDLTRLRRLYGRYPTGVAAICALDEDGSPVGIVATSFTPVSMQPALVSICIQHTSTTWPRLAGTSALGVSVLATDQEAASRQLAAKNVDRFAGTSWFTDDSDAVFLTGAAAWLECTISTSVTAGDHDVVLLEVHHSAADDSAEPLVFHGSIFRSLAATERPR